MNDVGPDLVSASWIARIAGVTASTVSNWQRRHADFPLRVGDTGRFDRRAVLEWLARRGLDVPEEHGPGEGVWRLLDAVRGVAATADLVDAVGRSVVLEHLRRSAVDRRHLAKSNGTRLVVPATLAVGVDAAATLRTWLRLEHPQFLAGMFSAPESETEAEIGRALSGPLKTQTDLLFVLDSLLSRERGLGRGVEHRSSELLATVMTGFAPAAVDTLLDPAVGYGVAAISIARARGAKTILGAEISIEAGRIFLARSLLAGIDAVLRSGDALLMRDELRGIADLVVLAPPFSVTVTEEQRDSWSDDRQAFRTRDSDLLWLRLAAEARREHGTAIVHTTPNTAIRSGLAADLRAAMIEDETLQVVIGLPPGFADGSSIPTVLWVLGARTTDADGVVFIDASGLEPRSAASALGRRVEVQPAPEVAIVTASRLLDARANLSPKRWAERRFEGVDHKQIAALNARLESLPRLVGTSAPTPTRLAPNAHAQTTIRDLSSRKSVKWWKGSLTGADDAELGVSVADAGWVVRPGAVSMRSVPSARVPNDNFIVRPGDLLLARGKAGVHVRLWQGSEPTVIGSGAYLLRVVDESLLPEFLQICLLSRGNRRFADGERATELDIEEFVVPVMSIREQQTVVQSWHDLQARVDEVTKAADRLKWAAVDVLDALTSGAGIVE